MTHPHTKLQQNRTICSWGVWSELHQIWPGYFNTIGQCAAELL